MKKLKCPAGHALPNRGPKGACTPMYCAASAEASPPRIGAEKPPKRERPGGGRPKKKREDAPFKEVALAETQDEAVDVLVEDGEEQKKQHALLHGRFTERLARMSVPQGLTGAKAEEFADAKLVELLPYAVAEKEWRLKYGDPDARDKAASDILNATGRGKRDAGAALGATFVIIGGDGSGKLALPWAPKALKAEVVVPAGDAEVVK